jgi:hypothetical protein
LNDTALSPVYLQYTLKGEAKIGEDFLLEEELIIEVDMIREEFEIFLIDDDIEESRKSIILDFDETDQYQIKGNSKITFLMEQSDYEAYLFLNPDKSEFLESDSVILIPISYPQEKYDTISLAYSISGIGDLFEGSDYSIIDSDRNIQLYPRLYTDTVSIEIIDDDIAEEPEALIFSVDAPIGSTSIVFIINDDD